MTRAAALKTDDKEKGRNRPTGEDAGDQCRRVTAARATVKAADGVRSGGYI